MIEKAMSAETPQKVEVFTLPDGAVLVALHDNAKRLTQNDWTGWECDEVRFLLPTDRTGETVESITAAFDDWWAYGAAYTKEEAAPTLEERVACIENAFAELMDM